MSLLSRVAGASVWTAGGQQAMAVISFALSLVIARLIVPEQMGRYALVSAIVAIAASASSLQTGGYYMVTREPSALLLKTGLALELITGGAMAALLSLGALAYALLGGDVETARLLALAAVVLVINPFGQLRAYWARRLEYARQTATMVACALVSAVVKVGLVAAGLGAYGLVIGELVYAALFGLAMWLMLPIERGVALDRECVRRQLAFGVPGLAAAVLAMANTRTGDVVVAAVSGPAAVGVYYIAARIPEQVNQLGRSMSVSLLPAFSQATAEQRARGFHLATRFSAFLTALPLALFIPFAGVIVVTLFGGRWEAAATPLVLLQAGVAVRHTLSHVGTFLKATERMRQLTVLTAGNLALTVAFVVSGALLDGLRGAALGVLAVEILMVPWKMRLLRPIVPDARLLRSVAPPLAAAAASTGLGLLGAALLPEPVALALAAALSVAVFGAVAWRSEPAVVELLRARLPFPRRPRAGTG